MKRVADMTATAAFQMRWAIVQQVSRRTRSCREPIVYWDRVDAAVYWDRSEALARLGALRMSSPSGRFRIVRLVSRADRLQRELDEARSALGAAWLHDGASLADGIRRKTRALERLSAGVDERQRIVDAILLCTRDDLPAEVDERVRARMLSRDGGDALTTASAIREYSAILATWVARGCP